MAKTVSEEEIQLRKRARRRLVGAVALVIAAVVILPLALDHEPKQGGQEIEIRIPSENSAGEFAPKIIPEVAAPAAVVPEKPSSAPQAQPTPVAEKPMEKPAEKPVAKKSEPKPEPKLETKLETKPEAKPETKIGTKPAANADAFVVQLGAFSDPAKARQRQQSITSNGIKAYTEMLKTDKGEMTRVRAGPFATREAAEKTREKLKKLGLDGVVTNK